MICQGPPPTPRICLLSVFFMSVEKHVLSLTGCDSVRLSRAGPSNRPLRRAATSRGVRRYYCSRPLLLFINVLVIVGGSGGTLQDTSRIGCVFHCVILCCIS